MNVKTSEKETILETQNLPKNLPQGYVAILEAISSKIKSAQARAISAINHELIEVYREIGKTIHKHHESGEWGDSVVKTLATDLQKAFPGIRGFSSRNLWIMKDFYTS